MLERLIMRRECLMHRMNKYVNKLDNTNFTDDYIYLTAPHYEADAAGVT